MTSGPNRRKRVVVAVIVAVAVIAVAGALVYVPPAGWTSNDVTTGQHPGYPDLKDCVYDFSPDQTLAVAAGVAARIPRWKVTATDRAARIVRCEVGTAFGGFTDDLEIHVLPEGDDRSRVRVRSHSRVGQGDLGENSRHIRALIRALDQKLPAVTGP